MRPCLRGKEESARYVERGLTVGMEFCLLIMIISRIVSVNCCAETVTPRLDFFAMILSEPQAYPHIC